MCHKCYNKEQSPKVRVAPRKRSSTAEAPPTPTPKRVRRTHSDPGEPANLARKRTRAQPPTTVPAAKKTRVYTPAVDPSLLLDLAHAARLALLAAERTDAPPVKRASKKIVAHPATWRLVVCD